MDILFVSGLLGPFIFGVAGWFFTGIDDLLIFSSTYHTTNSNRDRWMAIAGLLTMVIIMELAVVFSGGMVLGQFKWSFLVGFLPLYLVYKTLKGGDSKEPPPLPFFVMGFLGFFWNCSDDFIYNTAVITGKPFEYQLWYLLGVFGGAVIMIFMAHFLVAGKIKDHPKVRALILFGVSVYILYPGIEQLKQLL